MIVIEALLEIVLVVKRQEPTFTIYMLMFEGDYLHLIRLFAIACSMYIFTIK